MPLCVCVSATSTDGELLSTSSSLRPILGATSTAAGTDAYQIDVIRRASRWAERVLGYPLQVQTYGEAVPAYGGTNLVLSRTPIRAVLRFFDSTSTADATAVCSSDFRVWDADAGFLQRDQGWEWTAAVQYRLDRAVLPNTESRPWYVEYVAGWTISGLATDSPHYSTTGPNGTTDTGRTLPEDIEQAVLLKAAELIRANPGNVLSESAGDLSVTYQSAGNYRSEALDLLRPYVRMA